MHLEINSFEMEHVPISRYVYIVYRKYSSYTIRDYSSRDAYKIYAYRDACIIYALRDLEIYAYVPLAIYGGSGN